MLPDSAKFLFGRHMKRSKSDLSELEREKTGGGREKWCFSQYDGVDGG